MSRQPDHRGPAWSDPNPLEGEERQELDLRPKSLAEFVGQESVRGLADELRTLAPQLPVHVIGGAHTAAELDAKAAIAQASRLALSI